MNKLTKMGVVCFAIAVSALCVAGGGLLALHALNIPQATMLPTSINFALLYGGVMLSIAAICVGLGASRTSQPAALC